MTVSACHSGVKQRSGHALAVGRLLHSTHGYLSTHSRSVFAPVELQQLAQRSAV
jgi:hypothetical protein